MYVCKCLCTHVCVQAFVYGCIYKAIAKIKKNIPMNNYKGRKAKLKEDLLEKLKAKLNYKGRKAKLWSLLENRIREQKTDYKNLSDLKVAICDAVHYFNEDEGGWRKVEKALLAFPERLKLFVAADGEIGRAHV